MGRLILIRHGESQGNRDRAFTSTPAVPLTEVGRQQVEAAGEVIAARYTPVRIVSSPFQRARETAGILARRLGLAVEVEEDLRERSYGILAGQPYAAVRSCTDYDPECYWLWCPPGGGETLVSVAARAGAVLDRVASAAPDADVVVVSHGAVMMALWQHVTGSWRAGRVSPNAGIVVVDHEGERYHGAEMLGP
jgi:ribonuclease H / adenosylcobalamin/alpha-ribazole phosphatase